MAGERERERGKERVVRKGVNVFISLPLSFSFFGVVALYISVGVLIQAIRGKKGKELIPNHKLWGAIFLCVVVSLISAWQSSSLNLLISFGRHDTSYLCNLYQVIDIISNRILQLLS